MEVLGPEGAERRGIDGPYKENWDMAKGLRTGALLGRRNKSRLRGTRRAPREAYAGRALRPFSMQLQLVVDINPPDDSQADTAS
jgi:hypothetical protein